MKNVISNFRRFFICFIFLASCLYSYGQIRTDTPRTELDSLIRILPEFYGKEKVDHLNLIATSISQRYPDSCLYYADAALELSKSLNYEFGEAEAVFNLGNGYFYKIDVKESLSNYLKILPYFKNISPTKEYGNLLMQIGFINGFVGNNIEAIKSFKMAGKIYKETNLKLSQINSITEMTFLYIQAKLYDSAIYYCKNNIKECKLYGYQKQLAINYNNIGLVYLWRSEEIPKHERFEGWNAIPYFDSALSINIQKNSLYFQTLNLENLGASYCDHIFPPQYDKAIAYYQKSIIIAQKSGDYFQAASSTASLGDLYADFKNYKLAKSHLDTSLYLIKRLKPYLDTVVYSNPGRKLLLLFYSNWIKSWAYDGYFKYYKAQGNIDSSIYYYQLKVAAEDSANQHQAQNQIKYMLAKAENEAIDKEIALLEKEKELQRSKAQRSIYFLLGVGILFVLVVIIAYLYFRQNKLKTEQDKTNLQQKLLRTQMNPHFLFNSLASIQNFIIKEKPIEASNYLGKFSKLVRQILNNSVEEFVLLEDEISSIENYLELQKVRHRDLFEYTIDIDDAIEPETILVPPMLAQPFIENSIEHGFKQKEDKGNMKIRFSLNGNLIHFELEDNGIGREKAMQLQQSQNTDHRSMSTDITRERLQVLNKKNRQKISLSIIDLKDDKGNPAGTKVTFDIPFKN